MVRRTIIVVYSNHIKLIIKFIGNIILLCSLTRSSVLSTQTKQLNTVHSFVYFCYMFLRYIRKSKIVKNTFSPSNAKVKNRVELYLYSP